MLDDIQSAISVLSLKACDAHSADEASQYANAIASLSYAYAALTPKAAIGDEWVKAQMLNPSNDFSAR